MQGITNFTGEQNEIKSWLSSNDVPYGDQQAFVNKLAQDPAAHLRYLGLARAAAKKGKQ